MKKVFISYESSNEKQALDLVTALENRKLSCWIAKKDVPKGEPYDDYIPKAIAECSVVVMLFSEASMSSPHVKNELRLAVKRDKKVIPFMLEGIELREAFEYHIESNNRISADRNWDKAVEELLVSVEDGNIETVNLSKRSASQKYSSSKPYSEYIRCPHCECTVLKHKIGDIDKYLYPKLVKNKANKAIIRCYRISDLISEIVAVLGYCIIALSGAALEGFTGFLVAAIGLLLSMFHMASLDMNLRGKLVKAIRNSKVKYHTLKCAECEKEFGILLPSDTPLEECVEKLIEIAK